MTGSLSPCQASNKPLSLKQCTSKGDANCSYDRHAGVGMMADLFSAKTSKQEKRINGDRIGSLLY
jgi:hypothetical protein